MASALVLLTTRVGSVEKVGVAPEPKRVCPASGNLEYGDILCRLDPVRKLEAGLYHLPGLRLQPRPVDLPVDPERATLVVELVHLNSQKYLDSCHISFCSHMTVPARRTSDAVEGNACTTIDLRFISLFVRSWTLLVARGRVAIEGEGAGAG